MHPRLAPLRGLLASALCVALVSSSAAAQTRPDEGGADDPVRLQITPEAKLELASIDSESSAATVLYVVSTSLHVAGVGAGFLLAWMGGGHGSSEGQVIAAIASSASACLGLLGIFIAIGVDVDSGSRRDGWRERNQAPHVDVSFAPSHTGASLVLHGSF